MSFDYAQSAQDALGLLTDFGIGGVPPLVTLTRQAKGDYDPTLGRVPDLPPLVTLGVGLAFDYGLHASGAGTSGGSLILAGDRQLYLAALTADGVAIPEPAKNDKAVPLDGITYNVESVKILAPAGVVVLYELQLRR